METDDLNSLGSGEAQALYPLRFRWISAGSFLPFSHWPYFGEEEEAWPVYSSRSIQGSHGQAKWQGLKTKS